ncbi:MAG: 1-deoxy-D-xylulose-5-phosphate synthase [Clostridiales Family XIII bacterium]|jgi:1-deoxy-D-xylulose-5-phosphate synthase|nr:1-deoxy-D-xylulose-5-phosphate synthase [Clostridiales Family XIII bacterium]
MKKNLYEYDFPAELKSMSLKEMELLSTLIRDFLIENISKTGGHLASNLGVVELTVALHKVFDTPNDKIIWDVGHQCYVHKLLTGRAARFDTLRKLGGLSGFPKREESPHDFFNSGHSSNSVSAAIGFAAARDLAGESGEVIAVIGDGALTGGEAFEGLNNAGNLKTKLIVILNDNEMSISKNTGGMSQHLSRLRTSRAYIEFKKSLKNALKHIPWLGDGLYNGMERVRDLIKFMTMHSGTVFEEWGFKYFGPVDGHDIDELMEIMSIAKLLEQPVLIHVVTVKGKGYRNAESNPSKFHGIGPFDTTTGIPLDKGGKTMSAVLGRKLSNLADEDDRILAVTAAMTDGTGLRNFQIRHPKRIFDAGIAEAHAVSFAAGLACRGFKPYVAIYSTFLQRAYDQILEDVCMQNLPVTFCVDRAGNVGADGETHHGLFDLSFFNHIPNITVMAPMNGRELEQMLDFSASFAEPLAIRYSKAATVEDIVLPEHWEAADDLTTPPAAGKSLRIKAGNDVDIWAVGNMAAEALDVCLMLEKQGINAGLVNVRSVKPFDKEALLAAANAYKYIVTIEDNTISGGFGEKAAAYLAAKGMNNTKLKNMGWPDCCVEQGSVGEIAVKYRMDAKSLAEDISVFAEAID